MAPAQYELGQIYLQGEMTAADVDEARKWLQLAAFQGHPEAREKLENL
ncbi:MAG: SEL1-like repeat protein [Deltaproteobacteria bacterium]|nr:SEL1-like repeat protein [Deltaproteobacteria bacterium]